jgi:hypothetical protein
MTDKPNRIKKMNNWPIKDEDTFKEVAFNLCSLLDGSAAALARRKECKADRQKAKDALKEAGQFDHIPNEVEVFIMENHVEDARNVITVILPKQGEIPDQARFEAKKYWQCSWHLYSA